MCFVTFEQSFQALSGYITRLLVQPLFLHIFSYNSQKEYICRNKSTIDNKYFFLQYKYKYFTFKYKYFVILNKTKYSVTTKPCVHVSIHTCLQHELLLWCLSISSSALFCKENGEWCCNQYHQSLWTLACFFTQSSHSVIQPVTHAFPLTLFSLFLTPASPSSVSLKKPQSRAAEAVKKCRNLA